MEHETFWTLLRSGPHWCFELFLMFIFDVVLGLVIWPFLLWPRIKKWSNHHDSDDAKIDALERQVKELRQGKRSDDLKRAILGLLSWTNGPACSDCDMFRSAPSAIEWEHAHDCGHLASINEALVALGREPENGHHYTDPHGEMKRLAEERTVRANEARKKR